MHVVLCAVHRELFVLYALWAVCALCVVYCLCLVCCVCRLCLHNSCRYIESCPPTLPVGYGVASGRAVVSIMQVRGAKDISNPFGPDLGGEAWELGGGQEAEAEIDGGDLAASELAVERAIRQGGGFVGGTGLLGREEEGAATGSPPEEG